MHEIKFRIHVLSTRKKLSLTIKQTAERFNIGRATIDRWIKELEPKKRNKIPVKISNEAILEDVMKYPEAYQKERAARLGVSRSGIWYALKRNRISYKKKLKASESK